jgi:hypothetical protein
LATIAAILLPNKGFSHYYLLLISTAVVMATGLEQFSAFARSTLLSSRLAAVKDGPSTCEHLLGCAAGPGPRHVSAVWHRPATEPGVHGQWTPIQINAFC